MKEHSNSTPADQDNQKVSIAELLRIKRENAGHSLEALGQTIGFHPSYISRIERENSPASIRVITACADFLNCSRSDFLEASGHLRFDENLDTKVRAFLKEAIDTRKIEIK